MDTVPDMDDLLNELEATENNNARLKSTGEMVTERKIVLQDAPNGFSGKSQTVDVSSEEHHCVHVVSAQPRNTTEILGTFRVIAVDDSEKLGVTTATPEKPQSTTVASERSQNTVKASEKPQINAETSGKFHGTTEVSEKLQSTSPIPEKSQSTTEAFGKSQSVTETPAESRTVEFRSATETSGKAQSMTTVSVRPQSNATASGKPQSITEPQNATEAAEKARSTLEDPDSCKNVSIDGTAEKPQNIPKAAQKVDLKGTEDFSKNSSSSSKGDSAVNVGNSALDKVVVSDKDVPSGNKEIKQEEGVEPSREIVENARNENPTSTNVVDITSVHEADEKDSASDQKDAYSTLVLKRCNDEKTDFEKLCDEVSSEVDKIAERYAEMEQYLASCGMDDTSGTSELSSKESETETSGSSSDTQVTESEKTAVGEKNTKFVAHEMDNDDELQPASNVDTRMKGDWNDKVMKTVEKATAEVSATLRDIADEHHSKEVTHDTALRVEESDATDAHENEIPVNDSTSYEEASPSCCSARFASNNEASEPPKDEIVKTNDGSDTAREESPGHEEGEEAELMENGSDDSTGEGETPIAEIEEARAISVVASTHDISRDSGVKYLTESERQLGKEKPVWIADKETLSCMLCCTKFTVFLRRHHCRCCGRVLCAHCTTQKAPLAYANDSNKEHRVCDPCFETLKRIAEYEKNLQSGETDTNECGPSSEGIVENSRAVAKPALKLKTKPESSGTNDDQGPSSSDAAHVPTKRSVIFRDGVHPGDSPADETESAAASSVPTKPRKHGSKRQQISRRLKQLHVNEECVCLLPGAGKISDGEASGADNLRESSENNCVYLRNADGTITECDNLQERTLSLRNFEPIEVMIFRNLCCTIKLCKYEDKTVMCIASGGMSFVGLDEIFLAYYCDAESAELPIQYLWRIYEIYQNALTPQNESSDEELGIRPAQIRVPALNRTTRFSNSDEPVARDILLFRPSVQNFGDLLVPSSPFLVVAFIYQSESIWANVIPQRLLFRLGLQASFYPTPVVNDFERKPVYNSIVDTSVLKMFNDFRNWRFHMPLISGSTLTVRDNSESVLVIPTWENDEIVKLIKANKNMIAWGLDFNADADSHLVCEQDEGGSFDSQIFTNGVGNREVTGASFVVIDGALKGGDEPLTVNVLEDGMAIRLRSDVMETLIESLSAGQDFEQNSSAMKFSIKWKDPCARQFVGELVSPVDGRSLMGCLEYGLKKSRILGSFYPIPGNADWSLRLVSVYNVAKGRFAQMVQSKVFAVSEQIAAQIALTLVPFVGLLIEHDQRQIFFRIRVSTDDAEYKAQPWPGMEQEFATWSDLLDNQVAPGLFNLCSYITAGFHAELHMALISIRANP